ncbi:MAG: shikimate kinase [Ruminococcus sp.]|nr:shikimate kinase [Ruminococcus sp.]
MSNVILIGMPGSGKSTVGVLLAKSLGYSFVDTDLIISRKAEKTLQKILSEDGLDFFLSLEEQVGSTLDCDHTVVATGGSMVLSEKAMAHLSRLGKILYIDVPYKEIERRVTNITTRGITFNQNETLLDVYNNRLPLYKKYADLTVEVPGGEQSIESTVEAVVRELLNSE